MRSTMKGNLLLLLTALIWGMGFVAQSEGMNYVGPYTFMAARSFLAGSVLLLYLVLRDLRKKNSIPQWSKDRVGLVGGVCCGVLLFAATMFQQYGIKYEPETGKAGFITALYIIMVPIFGIFLGKKVNKKVWIAVVLATIGLYFLCGVGQTESNAEVQKICGIAIGDFDLFICSIVFTGQILCVDYFSPKTDGVRMSCIQFWVCFVLGVLGTLLFEKPTGEAIFGASIPILYAGVFSSGIAYTLQILGQKHTHPTVASLIMSLESVFAMLGGWIILHQTMGNRELFGCGLMFVGIILAQLPGRQDAAMAKNEEN